MPVCAVSNPSWESSEVITPTPINVAFDTNKNQTLHFVLENSQTVYFKFLLKTLTPSMPINISVQIYNANTLGLVSSLTSNSLNIESNTDLLAGTYIICMRAIRGSYTGTAQADYYGYSRSVTFFPEVGESGQEVAFDLKTDPKRKPCDKDMKWEIVKGSMPKGLEIGTYSGMVYGTLPYLDCIEDDDGQGNLFKDIPSANMFFTTGDEESGVTVYPWGRRWKFKLRISIVEQPENFDEQWFCISIFNNWSRSEAKFMENYDNGVDLGEVIKQIDKPYVFGLCPVDPCKIDKDVENVIKEEIYDWDGVGVEDNIIYLELNDDFADAPNNVNSSNKINAKDKSYTVYKNIDGVKTKQVINIEKDDETTYCSYVDHESTIEMDDDIVDEGNVYNPFIAEGTQKGYIQDTITVELESYEHYLSFRTWSNKHINTHSLIKEYSDSKLFRDFLIGKKDVKYEYIHYDPKEDEDDDGTMVEKHFIYIYYEVDELPEVKYLEEMIEKEKQKGPWDVMIEQGESVLFDLRIN